MCAPQPSEGTGNVQPVQTAHSTRLHSHVLPQPPLQGQSPQGLLQRGCNCGKSCMARAPGPGAGPSRPSWLGDRPRKDAGRPFSSWSDPTHTSLPACPSHTTGVPGLSAVQEQLKLGWHRSACLCRHGWQHPRQGPVSFLSSLIRQDSRWSATREGAHGGARPSLRHCPHISAERRGAGKGQS